MSSGTDSGAAGAAAERASRRSGGAAWPADPPPPDGGGGGGGGGGDAVTVNANALVVLPPGVVTVIAPVCAPAGTVAESKVSEVTLKPAAAPPKATAVVPPRCVPVIVTWPPIGPLDGVTEARVGAAGGGGGEVGTRW